MSADILFPEGPERAARAMVREMTEPTNSLIREEIEFLSRLKRSLEEIGSSRSTADEERDPDEPLATE